MPSETDERDDLIAKVHGPPNHEGKKANQQKIQRQITVDSGFCGNSSESERGTSYVE